MTETLVVLFGNGVTVLEYNAAGAVSSLRLGNGRFESTQFNSRLQPTQIALGHSETNTGLLKLGYTYGSTDNNGNVLTQTITVPGMTYPLIQTYTYDSLNRLDDANETSNGTQTWRQDFSYDRYGNRNFVEANTSFAGFDKLCNGNTELCSTLRKQLNPGINNANNNRINSGQDYTYDSSGNTLSDANGQIFVYDGENKQVKASNGGGTVGEYSYDGDGKRVKKYVPSTGETTIFVYDAAGKLIGEYSTIVANSTDAKVAYLTADHLGSPRINTDVAGAVIARHDYHPFGEEITSSQRTVGVGYEQDTIRKQFNGYERDDEIDLDYVETRMYSSQVGRFFSSDRTGKKARKIPQSWNRYAYVFNRPYFYTDLDGMWPTKIHDLIIRLALPNLTSRQINAIQVGSWGVDVPWTFFGKYANEHAMRRPGQSIFEAIANMNSFIATNNQIANEEVRGAADPSETSLFYFGRSTHPITDNTSPMHRFFQEYDDAEFQQCITKLNPFGCYRFGRSILDHTRGESFIFSSDLQAAISAVRDNYRSVYGEDALKRATGIFGSANYSFSLEEDGALIDGEGDPTGIKVDNLGIVTVRGDGSAEYEGPLTPVDVQPKKKKKK